MLVLPLIGIGACAGLVSAARRRVDWMPFVMSAGIFTTAFAALTASFLPYMIPF